jgi:23S rRNA pseudouridine1911/1915/1917 synthase
LSTPIIVYPPERLQWQVPIDLPGTIRADILISQRLPILSRRIREELFLKKAVRVNGRPVAKGFRVSPGDRLEIEPPGPLSPYPLPDQGPRPFVVFEDQSLVIIEKPGLMPTHPLSPFETGTLANVLVSHWPRIVGVGNKPLEPGLVHRLDTGTSGLLAVALKQATWLQLKKDLAAKRWTKTYQALVEGSFSNPSTISLPLAHDPADNRKMKNIRTSEDTRRGRVYKAISQIRPMKVFIGFTLVEVKLITGVTHQIRAHLSFQGHPVVGDTLYGSKTGQNLGLPFSRFFLHAGHLSFPHPITREQISCNVGLPQDLQEVLSLVGY